MTSKRFRKRKKGLEVLYRGLRKGSLGRISQSLNEAFTKGKEYKQHEKEKKKKFDRIPPSCVPVHEL